jgi:hypothetical protein
VPSGALKAEFEGRLEPPRKGSTVLAATPLCGEVAAFCCGDALHSSVAPVVVGVPLSSGCQSRGRVWPKLCLSPAQAVLGCSQILEQDARWSSIVSTTASARVRGVQGGT